jgi:hypothetical protein
MLTRKKKKTTHVIEGERIHRTLSRQKYNLEREGKRSTFRRRKKKKIEQKLEDDKAR